MSRNDETVIGDEALSALVDGELGTAERRRVVGRLVEDDGLRARWTRYYAGRASLEGAAPGVLGSRFSDRVLAAVHEEPVVMAPGRTGRAAAARWLRPIAGVAVAAGVAAIALTGLVALRDGGLDRGAPVLADGGGTARPVDASGLSPVAVGGGGGFGDDLPPAQRERLRQRLSLYLSSHSEFAGAGEMPGMMPYSRMVGINAGQ